MQLKKGQSSFQGNRNILLQAWKDEREGMMILALHNSKAVHMGQKARKWAKTPRIIIGLLNSTGT
jgi:hypothetical protein